MQTIFYNITHGYRSKIDPDAMFTREEDARRYDVAATIRVMSNFSPEKFRECEGAGARQQRALLERAARYLADYLKDLSDEEDRAASAKEQAERAAAETECVPPVAEERPDALLAEPLIENHTINRDDI